MKFCVITLILLNPIMAIAGSLSFDKQANSDVIIVERDAIDAASDATGIIRTGNSLAEELASINQPNLITQQTRVKFFRQMFAMPLQAPQSMPLITGLSAGADALIEDADHLNQTAFLSEKQAAIESLQNRVAARQPPNPLLPFGSLATAFHLISNGVAKIMIRNLDAGHLPIYGEDGAVIGTRNPITGDLTAGREGSKGKGQTWNDLG